MDVIFKDLIDTAIDNFISQDMDKYARITRRETELDHTVDLLVNVKRILINEDSVIISFPNNNSVCVPVSTNDYFKIEVM